MALLRAELGGTLRAYFMMASCLAAAALMLVTLAFALCAWQTSGGTPLEILFLSCMLFPTGSHACACRRGPSLSKSPSGSRDFILGENAALRVERLVFSHAGVPVLFIYWVSSLCKTAQFTP